MRFRSALPEVTPRTLGLWLLAIVGVGAIFTALLVVLAGRGSVDLAPPTSELISFAGVFPAEDEDALSGPLGIAAYGNQLYVAEADAGTVRVFRPNGALVADILVPAQQAGSTAYPSDLAVIDRGCIAVVENTSQRVLVLDTDPDAEQPVLFVVGECDSTSPGHPTAVAYAQGELFVYDGVSHSIWVYSAEDGSLVREIGANLKPALTFVGGLTLDDAGRLYVADTVSGRVIALDGVSGKQLGVLPQTFSLPKGVSAGPDETLMIVDTFACMVTIADRAGDTLDSIGEESGLVDPRDAVWISSDERVYVTDASIGRILVFNVRLSDD
ncbi:MAG: hypothetical protein U1F44_07165 [Coriobacteriia bacterium]|nr:hypothetical protein [Coriobacteriia bacterium]